MVKIYGIPGRFRVFQLNYVIQERYKMSIILAGLVLQSKLEGSWRMKKTIYRTK